MNYIISRNNELRNILKKGDLSDYNSSYDKLIRLKDCYKNKKCIITTCGPSFLKYKDNIFDIIDDNTILICVKTTYSQLKHCDFYIPGEVNNLSNDCQSISIGIENPTRIFGTKADINLKGFGNRKKMLYDIAKGIDSFSFENNALSDKNNMICHLGHAMHGVALPLAVHLGIKNIGVIGWDGHKRGINSHFDKTSSYDFTEYGQNAVIKCNEILPTFLKTNFDVNIYQINEDSLYTKIPKITIDEFKKL